MMDSVLVVDDDLLARVGFSSAFPWAEYGYEIVGQAENGVDALEKVRSLHPNIVITDIRMPEMDGIELIRILREQFPEVLVIVLSSFNDYDLVRQAMKLGAYDYLLKLSMTPESLMKTLEEARQEHLTPNGAGDSWLARILGAGPSDSPDLPENWNGEVVAVAIAGITEPLDAKHARQIRRFVSDRLSGVAEMYREKALCLIPYVPAPSQKFESWLRRTAGELQEQATDGSSQPGLYFGVSQPNAVRTGIWAAITQAITASQEYFYDGVPGVAIASEAAEAESSFFSSRREQDLYGAVDRFSQTETQSIVQGICSDLENRRPPVAAARRTLRETVFTIERCGRRYDVSGDDVYAELDECALLSEARQLLVEYATRFVERVEAETRRRYGTAVTRSIAFMRGNYSSPISLADVANAANLSRNYLGNLFKKEVGIRLTSYLNEYRISVACGLIESTDLMAKQICEMVGFTGVGYFCRVFKHVTGMTVQDYRRNHGDPGDRPGAIRIAQRSADGPRQSSSRVLKDPDPPG